MNIRARIRSSLFAAIVSLLLPVFAYAAGIDEITNYKSPPVKKEFVEPYTIKEIMAMLPAKLNDQGVYGRGDALEWDDPRAKAFDEENFGKCRSLYFSDGDRGRVLLWSTLRFIFPEDERSKEHASFTLKDNLTYVADPRNHLDNNGCENRAQLVAKLKELLNTIIQAAPSILQEKQRIVDAAREEVAKRQKQQEVTVQAKKQAVEKAEADRQAIMIAEKNGSEERANKLKTCQNANAYKLYGITDSIEINKVIAKKAKQEIENQEAGAKISGYVDTQVMHKMGNIIAGVNKLNKENFVLYKNLGGSARSLESVYRLRNPCNM